MAADDGAGDFPLIPLPLTREDPGSSTRSDDELEFPIQTSSFTTLPSLVVNVDFNALLVDHGQEKALEIVGILKDLLAVNP